MQDKLEDTTSTLADHEIRTLRTAEEICDLEEAFWEEIETLIDKEITENQIVAADVETIDPLRQFAVLTVWRRAAQGDCIEELRSLVDKDGEGNLRCRIIKRGES